MKLKITRSYWQDTIYTINSLRSRVDFHVGTIDKTKDFVAETVFPGLGVTRFAPNLE